MPKLSVIIVNFNTKGFLKECIGNLRCEKPGLEIIVVDNSSTDGSFAMTQKEFPEVILIGRENKGLAAGYNRGLEKATGDYVLFLGADAYPKGEVLQGLTHYMETHPEVGIATPKLVLRNGVIDWDCHRGFPTPWAAFTHFSRLNRLFFKSKVFNQYFLGYLDFETSHEIDLCISHFMFVRRSVFEKVGLWDEGFFVYGEDVDFCYRVKEAGWKVMYLPQWEVLHYKGASVGIRKETEDIAGASKETKNRMRSETVRAMKLFYQKHYTSKYPAIVNRLTLLGINLLSKLRGVR